MTSNKHSNVEKKKHRSLCNWVQVPRRMKCWTSQEIIEKIYAVEKDDLNDKKHK